MSVSVTRRLGRMPGGNIGVAGAVLFAGLLLAAVAAPLLAPHDPYGVVGPPFDAPSWQHPLGTNDIGQDIFSELIYGARISLLFGLVAAVVATAVGTSVGLTAVAFGGWVDAALMRLVDLMLVLPFLPLVITLAAFFGGGIPSEIALISLVMWARPARELRAQAFSVREREHVQAATAMGASRRYVILAHLLPGILPLLMPQLVRAAKGAIMLEASVSFLGLGDSTIKSWGTMLYYANARSAFLTDVWLWWVVPPGLCIGAAVLAFAFLGYGFEERANPRLTTRPAAAGRRPVVAIDTAPVMRLDGTSRARSVLEVQALTVTYGDTQADVPVVKDVSLDVSRSEVLGIVGESGSGKTTLAHAVIGLLPRSARVINGRIVFAGTDLGSQTEDQRRRLRGADIALVPQSAMHALNPVVRVVDQVAEAVVAHTAAPVTSARARAVELLEMVGIVPAKARSFPHQLSGGMRQRSVIAMALANDPKLLIADEPTTGLDLLTQHELLSLLARVNRDLDVAVMFISHDLTAVARIAHRVAVMHRGRIVEVGPVTQVLEQPVHAYTRRLVASAPRLRDWTARPASRPGAGAPPILEVRGLGKSFPSTKGHPVIAMDNVTMSVHQAEIVGIVGASGAGKTTLARTVVGLIDPDVGAIAFEGRDLTALTRVERRAAARRYHMVFQDPYAALPPNLRVADIVAEPLRIHREKAVEGARDESVDRALDAVSLTPVDRFRSRYPHELSGGERQRVALARAIVLEPSLIVADEPASLLDASLRLGLVRLMMRLRDRHQTAYLYITHDLVLAQEVCDRLVVMFEGEIVETGSVGEIFAAPRHPHTVALLDAVGHSV